MTPEFDLIAKYFTRPAKNAALGVGDDCALVNVTRGCELAISTDTLLSGVHFFADADPFKLGHKALAANLSDLAAMGATPRYVTLALTLPSIDATWLDSFSRGFFALANAAGVELIGGDTTRGPLSMTLTVLGEVEAGKALRRDRARTDDDVWVSGTLGDAALALRNLRKEIVVSPGHAEKVLARLHTPTPRNALGCALLDCAEAAIDISDGLIADLGHICERSSLAAKLEWALVPQSPALMSAPLALQQACALAGGDDYELCFTANENQRAAIEAISASCDIALTRIGKMQAGIPEVTVHDEHRAPINIAAGGFDHFKK